jgi:hypothetical protein
MLGMICDMISWQIEEQKIVAPKWGSLSSLNRGCCNHGAGISLNADCPSHTDQNDHDIVKSPSHFSNESLRTF